MSSILVTFDLQPEHRRRIDEILGDVADIVALADLADDARIDALRDATVMLCFNTGRELRADEYSHLTGMSLIQFLSAGVDFVPLHLLPETVPVAVNAGAYAEPMAEHALAMILAAAKRLLVEHENLRRGEFNQTTPTRMLAGMTAGIVGFGGIGTATARLLGPLGVRIQAINRRGVTDEPVERIAGPDALDDVLATSDVVVLTLPLTSRTEGLIDRRRLSAMRSDAVLVNMARGEIVDEDALYDHLRANPDFVACIDAWWVEPVRHGEFRMDRPFTDLPNVIGSPHNSSVVKGWIDVALGRALENCRRALTGGQPRHLIGEDERSYGR